MIAPVDAVAQVRGPQSTSSRVPVPPESTETDQNRLTAPLANFEDGFSSDQGAFLSGAETEREVTPITDREDTPVWEVSRKMADGGATRSSTLYGEEAGEENEDRRGGGGQEQEDIVKTAKINIRPSKDIAADEARASLLHDSLEMDMDETSGSSPPPIPQTTQNTTGSNQFSSLSRRDSISPNSLNQQLRQQYEIQALSRPRPTTPVSACAIESFVANNPEQTSDGEKMKISLPFSSSAVPDMQLEETKQPSTAPGPAGSQRGHRRRSSMSWLEFQGNMAASGSVSGRVSGRTTPLSMETDQQDLLEHNPFYQDRVPPSPVVHRRSSREWVDFEAISNNAPENDTTEQSDEFKAPPLTELVSEIQETVSAWSKHDYNSEQTDDQGRSQDVPSPPTCFDHAQGPYSNEAGREWKQQETTYNQFHQRGPPSEPYHYAEYGQTDAQRHDSNMGLSAYELDSSYPPPPPPFASTSIASSSMDDWTAQAGAPKGPPVTDFQPLQYVQPTTLPSQDDWGDSPYARMQLSYEQQGQLPAEPVDSVQAAGTKEIVASAAPSRSAPPPPRPPVTAAASTAAAAATTSTSASPAAIPAATAAADTTATEIKENMEGKENVSEDWLAYQRMTQKMSNVMKHTKEKLQEMQKDSVASTLPSTPYEVSMGVVTTQQSIIVQRQPSIDHQQSIVSVPPTDLLSSDFEPPPPDASTVETPHSSGSDPGKEWKPIHQVLNEEIKKQKELQKPKRPPPPKTAPQRPPRPSPTLPSWEDPSSVMRVMASENVHTEATADSGGSTIDTFIGDSSKHWEASSSSSGPREDPFTGPSIDTTPPQSSSVGGIPGTTQPHNDIPGTTRPSHFDVLTPITPSMDKSIPFTRSDVANQNHTEWKSNPEDDALFDVSKYANVINGGGTVPSYKPPPPVPPPRSPGPDRMFVIEKDESTTVPTAQWTDFDSADASGPTAALPPSESEFYLKMTSTAKPSSPFEVDPFAPQQQKSGLDLLGSMEGMEDSYDPFAVKSPDQLLAEAKAKAQAQMSAREAVEDLDFFGAAAEKTKSPQRDEETDRSESPGFGFRDSFVPQSAGDNEGAEGEDDEEGALYDEDDSQPLLEFPPKFTGDGWEMMLRFPVKKKMMAERCWKPVYVRLQGANIEIYYGKNDRLPFQTLPLLANYCLSDVTTQQYDIYGKIHTVKLQYVIYKEKVGIRPGQIPRLVEGHFTKLGLPLEHAAQTSVLLKFGTLQHEEMQTFVYAVEETLFRITAVRERPALYKQDEVQVHCYDEYASHVNKDGAVSDQRARVRLFCLTFVSGMPLIEIGLNDRRRQGKEVVRRKDIMPMYTERWIRFEAVEFHSCVDRDGFEKEHVIRMPPLDACFFEVFRFRVRPPRGKELPLQVRSIMKIAGSKIEIRIEAMVAVFKSRKARQVPCEDIQIRFPIPEAWIYLFREERHWGYGSVHAKVRRPGKVKNIKDKIMGIVQNTEASLIEVAIGDAKYEHVYRSLVWRIPRLPEKHHGAYKTHLLRCRFELSSFDLMPETFIPNCDVEYTMPMATVSHTVVRSVSIDRHEDPDKVEKWVRYLAKYQYTVEIDYVQTTDLDIEAIMDTTVLEPEKSLEKVPVKHQPSLDIDVAKEAHQGYRIDFSEAELGGGRYEKPSNGGGGKKSSSDSSDDEDSNTRKRPLIQIDIKNYQY